MEFKRTKQTDRGQSLSTKLFLSDTLSLCLCASISGPDNVKIENADAAVATMTGLEVGRYEFTLTVTDDRKLKSTDTVIVIVREGEEMRVCVCVCVHFTVYQHILDSMLKG